jgi:hypothetical protein
MGEEEEGKEEEEEEEETKIATRGLPILLEELHLSAK